MQTTSSNDETMRSPDRAIDRRRALTQISCGFGSLAFSALAAESACAGERTARSAGPLAASTTHLAPRAKRVIFLFMQGGPSQVDTFDPKPLLQKRGGEDVPFYVPRHREVSQQKLLRSPWSFERYGERGQPVSELFPRIAEHVDDLCIIRSMHTEGVAHGPATLFLHTGATSLIRPSIGSWITYGLGTENDSLPGFISISPSARMGGPRNYASAFLPASYQGTKIGRVGVPSREAGIPHLTTDRISADERRRRFELLRGLNRDQFEASERDAALGGVLNSFELAFRMQTEAPELMDLSGESKATLSLYGVDDPKTEEYGRMCLQARRFAEAGVRYIQVNYSDNSNNPRWDQHSNLERHAIHARATDKPVAGLLADLKSRGLLEDTLVWWGAEFGRTPFAEKRGTGRDHNPKGFTLWLAGGGVKAGYTYGATDEWGFQAIENKVHMHDLHATILHILGVDHERLTYRYAGRDFRLTDVYGNVVHDILG